jgi:hypothetical protein
MNWQLARLRMQTTRVQSHEARRRNRRQSAQCHWRRAEDASRLGRAGRLLQSADQQSACGHDHEQSHAARTDAAHYFIDASTAEGLSAGLHRDSLVSCLNLAVLTASDVVTKIGDLPPDAMDRIDECLKVALGIP